MLVFTRASHAVLTVVSVVLDEDGGYVAGSRNTINLMLRNETLAGKNDPAADPSARNVRVIVR
jgi:hypothetical protein